MTSETSDVHQPSRTLSPAKGSLENYSFPVHRLKQVMDDPEKTPLLLVACGSFSPITYLHLRLYNAPGSDGTAGS